MNNMRVLICATFALLVAALVYFYVNSGTPTDSDDATIAQLEKDLNEAQLKKYLSSAPTPAVSYTAPTPAPAAVATPEAPRFDAISQLTAEEKKAKEEEEINRLADEIERQRLAEAQSDTDEALIENQAPPVDATRQQWITQASVMAKVIEFDKANLLIAANVKRPGAVVPNMVLGIRRNTGIIGRVKISSVDNGQAFADVIPASFFGKPVEINIGDELIIIP